jgi:hypothetical protein
VLDVNHEETWVGRYMMNDQQSPLQKYRLHALSVFLQYFDKPDFEFGNWDVPSPDEPDAVSMPYYSLSEVALSFQKTAYENGWVLPDFDWPSWIKTPEAKELRDKPESLARATKEQLAFLLTFIIRQDRFCEGTLASAFDSGLLSNIIRRASALESELTKDSFHG